MSIEEREAAWGAYVARQSPYKPPSTDRERIAFMFGYEYGRESVIERWEQAVHSVAAQEPTKEVEA